MICKICGTELNGSAVCPVCGNPADQNGFEGPAVNQDAFEPDMPVMAAAPAKKPVNKKIIGIIIAAVLVVGIAVAAVLMVVGGVFKSDISKVFGAVRKTVFESSSMTVEIKVDGDTVDGKLVIGEGISDTKFNLENDGEMIGLSEGEIYQPYQGTFDIEDGLDEYTELADEYGLDVDAAELVDTVLDKKIDEKALAKLYDETFKPWAEETIEAELEKSVTLPTYERAMELVEEFLEFCVEEEAIKIEKSKAEGGKQYAIDVDTKKVVECLIDFCEKTPELNDIMKEFELYEELEEVLEWELEDIDIVVVIDKKGYLSEVEVEMYDEEVRVVFTDINKTEITDEDVEEMEKSAEKEYSTEYSSGYYEDDYYYEDEYYDDDVDDYYDDVYEYCWYCDGAIYSYDDYMVDEGGDYFHEDCYYEFYDYVEDYDSDVYEYCWYCDGAIYYYDSYEIDMDGDYFHEDCYYAYYGID